MAIHRLICLGGKDCSLVKSLEVEAEFNRNGELQLQYALFGDLAKIQIPPPQQPAETEGLWNHTCFEAFVAVEGEPGYHEYNFSPSGQWAAFSFSGYRKRCSWSAGKSPEMVWSQDKNGRLKLTANIAASELPKNTCGKPFQLGLTAVVESDIGGFSYWAIVHPADRPDFHHRGGFACILFPKK